MKQRIQGKQLKEIAAKEYPNATQESGVVMVSQQLNKPEVKQAMQDLKLKALQDNGISWDHNIKVYKAAQEATKVIVMGKGSGESFVDEVPDYSVRVRATDSLVKIMDSVKTEGPAAQGHDLAPELLKALKNGDIKELQRVIFKTDE